MTELQDKVQDGIKVALMNQEGEKRAELALSPSVFGVPVKPHLIHSVVRMQEANHRRGTAKTKTRGEVSGGGAKPYRQKGTGRARQGSIRSPLMVGGGTVFGPKPRDYFYRVPSKERRYALKSTLSLKHKEGKLIVVDKFELEGIKTKRMKEILDKLGVRKGLIVLDRKDEKVLRSVRNIPGFKVLLACGLNVRDVLKYEHLVMTQDAVRLVEEALG